MSKVLVIEDSHEISDNIVEILELADYEVAVAKNGKQGVEMAMSDLPDVILCDIMMPELDGYGVLYMLSKNIDSASIPFIFLTAKAERVDFRKGMEMGADDYLTKPFDDIELLNAIEIRLEKKRKQEEFYSKSLQSIEKLSAGNGLGAAELKNMVAGRKIRQIKNPPNRKIKRVLYPKRDLNPHSREAKGF